MNVVALTMVHDRILHKGAKRCEGTSTLYTVGCQGSLRAARPESVTLPPPNTKPKSLEADPPSVRCCGARW